MKDTFSFKAKVQVFEGPAAWYYLMLPVNVAEEIEFFFAHLKLGWGSLPVEVTVGEITWKTSIFTVKKNNSFMLPLKLEIRKKEGINEGDLIKVTLKILKT